MSPRDILEECAIAAHLHLLRRVIALQLAGCPLPLRQALLWEAYKMMDSDNLRSERPIRKEDCRHAV